MVVDRGNHLIWRSHDLSKERSRSCRLHADHVPGGVETKLDECFQDAHRQLAAATVDDVLAASGLLLVWFLDMMWMTYVSIYWRKLGAFRWLDHQERGCELVALLLDRTGRQRKIESIWTLWNEKKEENAWELVWCGRGCLGVLL
jgi:hypothetical protein